MPKLKTFYVTERVEIERGYIVKAKDIEDAIERVQNGKGHLEEENEGGIIDTEAEEIEEE